MDVRINKKRYNTETSTLVKEIKTSTGCERLYVKPRTREYFLYIEIQNLRKIAPLDFVTADKWGKEHLTKEEYNKWFPDFIVSVKENGKVLRRLQMNVDEEYFNLIQKLKSEYNLSTSEVIMKIIDEYKKDK